MVEQSEVDAWRNVNPHIAPEDDWFPITLQELCKQLGRPERNDQLKMKRFLEGLEQSLGVEIMIRVQRPQRVILMVTRAALRRACPELFGEAIGLDPITMKRIAKDAIVEFYREVIEPRFDVGDERLEAIMTSVQRLVA
jgi:hypothetical protein